MYTTGWYSIRDEAFYAETELVDGKAPTGAPVEWVKESSYFFRLSEWTDKLLAYYNDHPDFIGPKGRRNEVVSFVGTLLILHHYITYTYCIYTLHIYYPYNILYI